MTLEIPRRLDNGDITQGAVERDGTPISEIGGGPTLLDRVTDLLSKLITNQPVLCGSGVPLHRSKVRTMAREILDEIGRAGT